MEVQSGSVGETSQRVPDLDRVVASLPSALIVSDRQGRVVLVNDSAERLLGCSRTELIGRALAERGCTLTTVEGRPVPVAEAPSARALTSAEVQSGDYFVLRPDGTRIAIAVAATRVVDGAGAVIGVATTFVDVTARVEAEATRRRLDVRFRDFLERSVDAVVIHRKNRFLYVNARTVAELGYASREDLIGRPVVETIIAEEDRAAVRERMRAAEQEGVPAPAREDRFVRKDGSMATWDVVNVPFLFEGQPAVLAIARDISARKQAEAERARRIEEQRILLRQLRRRVAEWEGVVSAIAEGVLVLDGRGDVLFVNRAMLDLVGASTEAEFRKPLEERTALLDLRYPAGEPIPQDALPTERALRGETVSNLELTLRRLTSRDAKTVRVSAAPIRANGSSTIDGVVLVAHDVTELRLYHAERERLHNEVQERRALLEALIESAPAAIGVLRGPGLVIELANSTMKAYFPGIPLLGRPFAEVAPEMPEVARLLETARTSRAMRVADLPLLIRRHANGPLEQAWFTASSAPLPGDGAAEDAVVGIAVETTDQVRARRMIEELATIAQRRAAQLQGILDAIIDPVFVCDSDRKLVLVNHAALRLLGQEDIRLVETSTIESVASRLDVRSASGTPLPNAELPLSRALRGETVRLIDETVHDTRGGRDVIARVAAGPLRDERGRIIGAVEVLRDETELFELDHVEGLFLRTAAHELKTPLTVIKGYVQLLLRSAPQLSDDGRKLLDGVVRGTNRIDRLVSDLLYISQLDLDRLALAPEEMDLSACVRRVVEQQSAAAAHHRIRLVRDDPAFVKGDRDLLAEVLVRLLDNAVRYSPGGGDIDVGVWMENDHGVISVRDRGVGIPKERQAHIFERFYRAHTGTEYDAGGMGIGLYVARQIVERHGGTIRYDSEEGRGTTFTVALPARGARASR